MLTVALIVALAWLVAVPLLVLVITELGWRLGEHRRGLHRSSRGAIVLFPAGLMDSGRSPHTGARSTPVR